jgi:hypothetical protein
LSKLASAGIAGLLALAVTAPAAAASPNVFKTSGSVTVAQVDWAFYDGDTFIGGYLVAAEEAKRPTVIEYFKWSETLVQCEGAGSPDDPSDDVWGYRIRSEFGYGPAATFTIGKSLSGAIATGVLTIQIDTADECTGEGASVLEETAVSVQVVGTSSLIRESGRGSFHIPGEINAHGSFRQVYRTGDGVATIGDWSVESLGVVGTISWRDHANGS